jgi:glycosyltransferase involved in cell wall biosynthesis
MSPINIMIFAGLGDNALDRHLGPLLKIDRINSISIVRNNVGKRDRKICYITPSQKGLFLIIISKFLKALRYARKNRVSYIHSFYLVPHGLIALILAKVLRRKVGVSLIGTDLDVHLKRRFYGFFLVWFLKLYDVVTVTGSRSREYLKRKGITPVILPHCIDTDVFRAEGEIKKFDLLYVGRLSEEKRVDRIVEIVGEIKRRKDLRLAIVGTGPREGYLKAMVNAERLERNILFLGHQDRVTPYYQTSRILMLMSAHEGLPFVLIEAMACGVVPAVLDVGDIGDIVNESNGLIFDKYNPCQIAESSVFFIDSPREYIMLQKNSLRIREAVGVEKGQDLWNRVLVSLGIQN